MKYIMNAKYWKNNKKIQEKTMRQNPPNMKTLGNCQIYSRKISQILQLQLTSQVLFLPKSYSNNPLTANV